MSENSAGGGEFLVSKGYVLPGLPHILLAPDRNPGWQKIRRAFDRVREEVESSDADVLIIYSTYWASVIGHQIQADPKPEWIHVDDQFHELGEIPYKLRMDATFAKVYNEKARRRGLHSRTVAYYGFPIDTGSVVVLKLINPDNKIPAVIVSSNVYADRAETSILGKAARDAIEATGKKTIAVSITSLSNRLFTEKVPPESDRIHSLKDEEWNKKFLEFFREGRLEDISQLSRQFHREARVNKVNNFKPFWWLAAVMGPSNMYKGDVMEYQPICGTGAAVIGLTPTTERANDLEFDEDDLEIYRGDRHVLGERSHRMGFEPEVEGNDAIHLKSDVDRSHIISPPEPEVEGNDAIHLKSDVDGSHIISPPDSKVNE